MDKAKVIEKVLSLSDVIPDGILEEDDKDFGPISDDSIKLGLELIDYVSNRFNIISSFQTKSYKETNGYSQLVIEYSSKVCFRIKDNIIECILFGIKNSNGFKKEKFIIHDTNKANTFNSIIKNYIGVKYPEIITQYRTTKLSKIKV